jgi:outer membrane protein insertion porin family
MKKNIVSKAGKRNVFKTFSFYFLATMLLISPLFSFSQVQIGGENLELDYAHPKEYVLGGIVVTGPKFLDETVLKNLSGLSVGDTVAIPGEKIVKAMDNLWKQGLFSDMKIVAQKVVGDQIFLEFQLQEKPRLSKFSFKGDVSKSDADKIREKINLERDRVITDFLISTTRNTVRDYYVDKGYLDTEVTIDQYADSAYQNKNIVTITVDKKDKVRIEKIIFHGTKEIKDSKLRRAMKDTKEKRIWKIFTSSKFIRSNYEKDKASVISKYTDRGFRDARIVSDTIYKVSPNRINIEMTIEEGKKYYFRNISWVGNTKHSSQELGGILGIHKGDVFEQSVLDERLYMNPSGRDVSSLYMDDGYLFFQITPVEVNVENDSIDLEMRIYEGKQATVNKVSVVGNTKTHDHVIMREVRTKPGQLFNRSDIIRTQRELSQLGYFNPEKLAVNPKPNPADGTVDIEYVVEEKPSDQVELSGGYGANQLVGTLGLSFTNFSLRRVLKGPYNPLPSGDGQRLSLRAQTNGKYYQSYNFSFTEPWLGGKKPNSLSTSVFRSIQTNGRSSSDPLRESITITGVSVGLGKRLRWPDDYFTLYNEISYQYYVLNNFSSTFLFNNGTSNNLSFSTTFSRNSIDQPIYPRTGSQVSLTAQFTPPYSLVFPDRKDIDYKTATDAVKYKLIEYHKWKFTSSWFTRLVGDLVLNAKINYGFLGYYNKDIGDSPFERFYVGGDGLSGFALDGREIIGLRGYSNNSLTPRNSNGYIGGTIFEKYTLEMRYPISLNPQATIFVLAFAEGGNSYLRFKEFNPFVFKRSAGFGIRVFLPIFGLLGLDWGYGFDEIPNTNPGDANQGQFHFSIGQQF